MAIGRCARCIGVQSPATPAARPSIVVSTLEIDSMRRRLAAIVLSFVVALVPFAACAAYPEKPVRLILPTAAGTSSDTLVRLLAEELGRQLGVPIVVDNRPGGSNIIGTMEIVKAAPDGYTLGYGNIVSLAINRSLLPSVPYDVERDLTLISNCWRVSNVLVVNNDVPVKSVRELVDYTRKNPDKLAMASGGNGTTGHLSGELFKAMTGTSMLHVPYRGGGQAVVDLMGGQAHVMFDNISLLAPYAKAGRVRALGVSGARRSPVFPDLPTIAEAGVPGYETVSWGGIVGPAGMPTAIVEKINAAVRKALASPALRERFRALDTEPDGSTPQEFVALVRRETPKWAEVVKRSGAKVD
jgi:tripartite-type tricarboxylate transporter receptor subunit TctC